MESYPENERQNSNGPAQPPWPKLAKHRRISEEPLFVSHFLSYLLRLAQIPEKYILGRT